MWFQNLNHLLRSFEVFPLKSLVLDLGIIGFNLPIIGLWSRGLLHGKARNHCVERVSGRVTISLELISSTDVEPFLHFFFVLTFFSPLHFGWYLDD